MKKFKIGQKVVLKYSILSKLGTERFKEIKLPLFIKWLLSTCPFDYDCIGEVISYNSMEKPLVRFNKPIFIKHPNKRDAEGYTAYFIDSVLLTPKENKTAIENLYGQSLKGIEILQKYATVNR